MGAVVIDTNVLLVANGDQQDASLDCQKICIERLVHQQKNGITVIDDAYRILREYSNKTRLKNPKKVGDVFLKWLLQNQANSSKVMQVSLNEGPKNKFKEFPDSNLQDKFDPPDRKFVAVANACSEKPVIWQAVDCKWLDWWPSLHASGVRVDFLCPEDVCRFYARKFPKQKLPKLPRRS